MKSKPIKFYVDAPRTYFHPSYLQSGELAIVRNCPSYYREHEDQLVIRVYDELWTLGPPHRCWELDKMRSTWLVRHLKPGEVIQVCSPS